MESYYQSGYYTSEFDSESMDCSTKRRMDEDEEHINMGKRQLPSKSVPTPMNVQQETLNLREQLEQWDKQQKQLLLQQQMQQQMEQEREQTLLDENPFLSYFISEKDEEKLKEEKARVARYRQRMAMRKQQTRQM